MIFIVFCDKKLFACINDTVVFLHSYNENAQIENKNPFLKGIVNKDYRNNSLPQSRNFHDRLYYPIYSLEDYKSYIELLKVIQYNNFFQILIRFLSMMI